MPANTVGVDIGGTKIAAARYDDDFNVIELAQVATPPIASEIADAVVGVAGRVWSPDVIALGAGVAGLVRWPEGVLAWVPHVKGAGVNLRVLLGEALGVPVIVDHDANCAALAEFEFGAGRSYHSGLLVTVGTGIGAGFIIENEIHRGRSFAGEVGHMRVEREGVQCPCGADGCWETMASGSTVSRLARAEARRNPDGVIARLAKGRLPRGEDVSKAAAGGDPAAKEIIGEVGRWFGIGLANLIAAFDPEVIVVGGGLGSSGQGFLSAARETVRAELYGGDHRPTTPILASSFGADAGMLGAALLAWRETSLRFRIRERTRRVGETLRGDEVERRRPRRKPRIGP